MQYVNEIFEKLMERPIIDAHTHLDARHLTARGLHDILLYHMIISELYAAGCPNGARLSEFPTDEEVEMRIVEALDYIDYIRNTSCYWIMTIILRDLYGFDKPLTKENWREADRLIREKHAQSGWAKEIADRARIAKACTEFARKGDGSADWLLEYALEWTMYTRRQYGLYDAPLIELEYAWSCEGPSDPLPVTLGKRPDFGKYIHTIDDVYTAMDHYFNVIPFKKLVYAGSHWSADLHYRRVSEEEMIDALSKRDYATPLEEEVYANFLQQLYLEGMQKHAIRKNLGFSVAAEPLPFETGCKLPTQVLFELGDVMAQYPNIKFFVFNAGEAEDQCLCTLAREIPNIYVEGYWWHNFYPNSIRKIMERRMDMLPANKQIGFFSDAYCLDWEYGKSILVRKQWAEMLSQKVEMGQVTVDQAVDFAARAMYDTTIEAFGFIPREI